MTSVSPGGVDSRVETDCARHRRRCALERQSQKVLQTCRLLSTGLRHEENGLVFSSVPRSMAPETSNSDFPSRAWTG